MDAVKPAATAAPVRRWLAALADAAVRVEPLWIIPFGATPLLLPAFDSTRLRWGLLGLGVVLAAWALRRWRRGRFSCATPLDIPFALFLAGAVIGLAPAQLPHSGLIRLLYLIGCVALFYTGVNHVSVRWLRFFLGLVLVGGVMVVLFILAQIPRPPEYLPPGSLAALVRPVAPWLADLPKVRPPHMGFWSITRDGISGTSMMLLPLLWPFARLVGRRWARALALVLMAVLGFALVASGGFGALVALLAGGLLAAGASGPRARVLGSAVAAVVALALASFLALDPEALHYILRNVNARLDLWQTGLYAIRDFPVTGAGLGIENWFRLMPYYAMPNLRMTYDNFSPQSLTHVHNFYLQTWIEQGVVGFTASIALTVVGLWFGLRYLRTARGAARSLVLGALWGFAALSIHNLPYAGPSLQGAIILWAVLGLLVAAGRLGEENRAGLAPHPAAREVPAHSAPPALRGERREGRGAAQAYGLMAWLCLSLAAVAWVGSYPAAGIAAGVAAGIALGVSSIAAFARTSRTL